jgi:hypothetical protein
MRIFRSIALAAAGLTGVAGVAAAAGPASAGGTPSWRIVKGGKFGQFTAVTVSSSTSAWAFWSSANSSPAAFELTHGAWLQQGFPVRGDSVVTSLSSTSARDVWAVSNNFNHLTSKVFRFDGHTWTRVGAFNGNVGPVLALGPSNAWLLGVGSSSRALHYNGHTWAPAGGGLLGGSALSANSIWAYGGKTVAHWNGHRWASTSVARQLPKNTQLCGSRLTGIYAASARNVYAIGTGGCQDQLGPFVLLHYNGSKWRRLVLDASLGEPNKVISDGHGGLWIPVSTGSPASGSMVHYGNGKLTIAMLPAAGRLVFFDAAIGSHTTTAYAVGFSTKSPTAVILRYGP